MVEIYITPFEKRGDETVGPTSVTHKREGLRGILDAEIPVRIEFPRNILHEPLSDIPNDFFNNLNSQLFHDKIVYNTHLYTALYYTK
jgi:hypothetical protein